MSTTVSAQSRKRSSRGRRSSRAVDQGDQRPRFHQLNYAPYYGDESFLAGPTKRTKAIWKKLTDLFVEERKKGVLDVSQIPARSPRTTPATSTRTMRSSSACRPMRR